MYTLTNFIVYAGNDFTEDTKSSHNSRDYPFIKEFAVNHRKKVIVKLNNFIENTIFFENDKRDMAVVFSGRITNVKDIFDKEIINNENISIDDYSIIIYELYLAYGLKFSDFVEGYYSVVICDIRNDKYLFARDSMGSYPLFYSHNKGGIFISDNIYDIANHDCIDLNLDFKAIAYYLHDKSFINPYTPFSEIRKLHPGCMALFSLIKQELSLHDYYTPKIRKDPTMSVQEAMDKSDDILLKIIKEYINSVDKIGVLFSGGVDSLFITSMLKKITNKDIYTYTVSPYLNSSESNFAADFAQSIGAIHKNIPLDGHVAKNNLYRMIDSYPTPDVDGWHIYMGTKHMNDDGVTLAFSGHGAEVSFGIDWWDMKYQQLDKYMRTPLKFIPDNAIRKIISVYDRANAFKNRYFDLSNFDVLALYMKKKVGINLWKGSMLSENAILSLLKQKSPKMESIGCAYKKYYEDSGSDDFVDQLMYARLMNFESNHAQGKNNFLAQCNGVALVLPFLDRRFLDFGLSIPNKIKSINGEYKHILLKLSKKYHEYKRDKAAFGMPFKTWHLNELKNTVDEVFSCDSISGKLLYKKDNMMSLLDKYKKYDDQISWSDIQSIISLDIWLRRFLK